MWLLCIVCFATVVTNYVVVVKLLLCGCYYYMIHVFRYCVVVVFLIVVSIVLW